MALALTACTSDEEDQMTTGSNELVPLNIVANIDVQARGTTRASETAWEEGDQIGVYITNHGTQTINTETTAGANLKFTFDDGANYETYGNTYRLFTPSARKFYLSSTYVDVYGYYPYSATKKDGTTPLDPKAIEVDLSELVSPTSDTNLNDLDLMRARTANMNNNNAKVELLFQHRMAKLVFNLKQGDTMLPNELKDATYLNVTIDGQPVEATYNIYEDAFTIEATSNTFTPIRAATAPLGYDRSYETIVLPNGTNNPGKSRTVTITYYLKSNDVIVNKFTIGSGTLFKSGYKYVYNVTVNATSVSVEQENTYTEQW